LRRSIRWYEPNKPVEKWKVQAMLEASRIAPSAGNFNGQRAIVVYRDEDPEIWEFISDWSQITTQMAPILVFWCYDLSAYDVQGQQLHDLMRTAPSIRPPDENTTIARLFRYLLFSDFVLEAHASTWAMRLNAILTGTSLGLGAALTAQAAAREGT
jgi:nitroreductase